MPRRQVNTAGWWGARRCASFFAMSYRTFMRYADTQLDLVQGAVEIPELHVGKKRFPMRVWPEPVLAQHPQVLELRSRAGKA